LITASSLLLPSAMPFSAHGLEKRPSPSTVFSSDICQFMATYHPTMIPDRRSFDDRP